MICIVKKLSICTMMLGLICGCGGSDENGVPILFILSDIFILNDMVVLLDIFVTFETIIFKGCTNYDDCDDEIECIEDICIIDGTCLYIMFLIVCYIDDVCYVFGSVNFINECEICDFFNFMDQWIFWLVIFCDDGDFCIIESYCKKGVCVGDGEEICCGNGILEKGETCDVDDCFIECIFIGFCKVVYE